MGAADSKAAVEEAVERVRSEVVTFQDNKLWDVIINSPQSSEDVVRWLKADELRTIRNERPRNFALLTLQVLTRLEEIIHATENIKPGRAPHMRESFFAEVLACLRLISRLLPILLEDALAEREEGGPHGWAHAFLWENKLPAPLPLPESASAPAVTDTPLQGGPSPDSDTPSLGETLGALDLNPPANGASGELSGTPAPVSPQPSESGSPQASETTPLRISSQLHSRAPDTAVTGLSEASETGRNGSKAAQTPSEVARKASETAKPPTSLPTAQAGDATPERNGPEPAAADLPESNPDSKADVPVAKKQTRRGSLSERDLREEEERQAQNVGRRVSDAVMALLFCENWTLPIGSVGGVWASGVRGIVAQPSWPSMDSIRAETLRTLLIICSEPLYLPPGKQAAHAKPFLFQVTESGTVHPRANDLFFSLLNLIISYEPGGWVLNHGKNPASHLVDVASHVLLALLDFNPASAHSHTSASSHPSPIRLPRPSEQPGVNGPSANAPGVNTPGVNAPSVNVPGVNAPGVNASAAQGSPSLPKVPEEGPSNYFRQLVASIDDLPDFALIYSGLVRLVNNPVVVSGEAVVQSTRRVDCYQEILVLCWKLLEGNPAFLDYVCAAPNVYDLLRPLLALVYTARLDSTKIGVMHVGAFILLLLSSRRSFGVALNKPASAASYAPLGLPRNFRGCHADALIHVLYKAMFNGGDRVAPLYSCLLTILANVTPYTKCLTMVTAERLVTLVEFFAQPRVFFGADSNFVYVKYLLEAINNIIQYQADGNTSLIYCILRKAPVFLRLFSLELPTPEELTGPAVPTEEEVSPEGGESVDGDQDSTPVGEGGSEMGDETGGSDSPTRRLWKEATKGGHWLQAIAGPPSPRARIATTSNKGSWKGSRKGLLFRTEDGGPNALLPEWLAQVQLELPLATVERMIKALQPEIDTLHAEKPRLTEKDVLNYLKATTLVGILPLPHSIVCRKYHANAYTDLWFTAYIWGMIYLRQQEASALPLADGQHVKLFRVTYMDVPTT